MLLIHLLNVFGRLVVQRAEFLDIVREHFFTHFLAFFQVQARVVLEVDGHEVVEQAFV